MGDIDISNYIYFIFLLLSLIFGALGNRKKKQKGAQAKEETPGMLEFIVNEFQDTGTPTVPKYSEKVEKVKDPETPLEKGVDIAKYAEELRRKSKRENKIKTSFDQDEFLKNQSAAYELDRESLTRQKANVDFDLRKAIINDAILHRVEYP